MIESNIIEKLKSRHVSSESVKLSAKVIVDRKISPLMEASTEGPFANTRTAEHERLPTEGTR